MRAIFFLLAHLVVNLADFAQAAAEATSSSAPIQHTSSRRCSTQHPPHQAFTSHCARSSKRVPWLQQVRLPHPHLRASIVGSGDKQAKIGGLVGVQGGQRRKTLKHALRALGFWLSGVFGCAGMCGGAVGVTRTVTSASASAIIISMIAVAIRTLI